MSNTHDGDEKIPTPSVFGRIRVKDPMHALFLEINTILISKVNFILFIT